MTSGPGVLIAGQYRLAEELGRGGFGVVWRARDERLHRDVAAKELYLPTYLGHDQRHERRRRGLREARSAARIGHPGAVTVYDVVEHDGCPWIIMELVDGRPLSTIVKREGPLAPRRAARIGLEILGALRAAHAAGVVHRDVKPGNVLVGERRAVLTDFGIATIEGDPALTHSGFVMGAPAYTAPERARGEPAVPASDLWSLGATLFYAVEGHRPYPGANANATLHAILNREPPVPGHAGPLAPVITGLMRPEAADRLTAAQATVMLQQVVEPLSAAGPGPWGVRPPAPARVGRRRLRPSGRSALLTVSAVTTALAAGTGTLLWPDGSARRARHLNAAVIGSGPSATLPRTPGRPTAVAFAPDGRVLAAATEDGTIRLFDVPERRQIAILAGHGRTMLSVAFSPDGRTLASGGHDGTVTLWDARRHHRLTVLSPGRGPIASVDFSPDGTLLAAAGTGVVQVWHTATRSPVKTFGAGRGRFTAHFAVPRHPAGTRNPAGSQSPARPQGATRARHPMGSSDSAAPPGAMTGSHGAGGLVIAGGGTVRVWRPGGRAETAVLGRAASPIRALAVGIGGTAVATGDDDGRVTVWDVRARRRITELGRGGSVHALAFSPDGRTLAGATGPSVTLWNVASRTRTRTLGGHTGTVGSVVYSPDGRSLATAGFDGTIRLWAATAP